MTLKNIRKYFKKKLLPSLDNKFESNSKTKYKIGKYYELGSTGSIEAQIDALESQGVQKGYVVPFFYLKATGTLKNLNLELKSEKIVIS